MIKSFSWGRKGGCIVASTKEEAYNEIYKNFPNNIKKISDTETCNGDVCVSFNFRKDEIPGQAN